MKSSRSENQTATGGPVARIYSPEGARQLIFVATNPIDIESLKLCSERWNQLTSNEKLKSPGRLLGVGVRIVDTLRATRMRFSGDTFPWLRSFDQLDAFLKQPAPEGSSWLTNRDVLMERATTNQAKTPSAIYMEVALDAIGWLGALRQDVENASSAVPR